VAEDADGGFRVFHHEPGGEDCFYLGWCHGPVGTTRLFHGLALKTGDDKWREWVHRGALSITNSNVPDKPAPGLWNNVGICCGTAGIASFFLDLHRTTGRRTYLESARKFVDTTMLRAIEVELPGDCMGLKWTQAEHRTRPDLLAAQTGFMQGAAGVGACLLQMDTAQTGRKFTLYLPDSPFVH